jgi:hypothetical protein
LRKEKWPWYITPIEKRKMAMVHHAHCEKKNGRGKSRKNGRGQIFEKWPLQNHEKMAAAKFFVKLWPRDDHS